ncbi:MAG: DinB family protein [Candidatus Bathyarchaeota archaeon]|nr:MAG: DinB family protein [Candidatus Bathyarchaeota archaeon]
MDKDVAALKKFTEFAFDSLERTCKDLTEKETEWRPMEESNDIRWILNHLSRVSNLSLPRIIMGDQEYTPEGWPKDYREQTYSAEKLMSDIKAGRAAVIEGLEGLTSEDLAEEIPLWGGTRQRQFALNAYLAEIVNHKGQIAMLRGSIKRRREKNEHFLV